MRIKAELTKGISVTCFFAVPYQQISNSSMNFIVDTGADKTGITEVEAERIGIDYNNLKLSDKPTISVAGKGKSRILNEVILIFQTDKGTTETFQLDSIHIIGMPKAKDRRILGYIPNLLGKDFLEQYKIRLIADYKKHEAYLEL